MSAEVIPLFAAPIAGHMANRLFPEQQQPTTLAEFQDAARLQVERERVADRLGRAVSAVVFVGVAAGVAYAIWKA